MTDSKTCTRCKYSVQEDNGYSNWTVMGTDFSCAKRLNPAGTFDMFYGEIPALSHADVCEGYEEGEGVDMDVDGENLETLSPEQKAVWAMHQGQP